MNELLAACLAAPDDDGPRLVWADSVGGERGELVVVQCMLARGVPHEDARRLRRRQCELLAAHGKAWSNLVGIATDVAFRRGFVEAATIDAKRFVDEADAIFERAPLLRSLCTTTLETRNDEEPVAPQRLDRLFRSDAFGRLAGLMISNARHVRDIETDRDWPDYEFTEFGGAALRAAPSLRHLRALGIKNSGAARTLRELAWPDLERLTIHEYCDDTVGIIAAITASPALTALDLSYASDLETLLPALPARIRELRLEGHTSPTDAHVHMLARSPCATTLERLSLTSTWLPEPAVLEAFPRLCSLLHGGAISAKGMPEMQTAAIARWNPSSTLRELSTSAHLVPTARKVFDEKLAHVETAIEEGEWVGQPQLLVGDAAPGPWLLPTSVRL